MDNQMVSLMSVGNLLRESFRVYKERFWVIIGLMAISFLGPLPLIIIVASASEADVNPLIIIIGIIAVIVAIIISLWAQVAFLYAIKERDSKIGIKQSLGLGWPKIGSYLWISILVSLVVLAGFILFIIPGIIFAVWFSLPLYVLISEELRGKAALSRSRQLVKGNWWQVFYRFFIAGFLLVIISLVFDMIPDLGSIVGVFFLGPFYTIFGYLIYEDLS